MLRVLRRLLGWLRPYRRQLIGAYLCLLLSTLLSLAVPKLLGETIDQGLTRGSLSLLLALALAVVAVAVLRGLTSFGQSYLAERVSQGVAYDLRNALYDKIQHLSFGYHDRAQTGQLMSRATQDVEQVQWWVAFGLIRVGQMAVLLVGTAVLLSLINWKLALVGLALLPLISYRAVAASPRLRRLWDRVQDKLGELSTVLQENLMGIRVVKAFNRERYEEEKFARKAIEVYTAGLDAAKVYNFHVPFMSFLIMTATGLVLWYGTREALQGGLTPGQLTQFIFYLTMLTMPVRMMGWALNLFSRAASAGARIYQVLDAQSPVQERPGARELAAARGEVAFHNVTFAYDSVPVLRNVSFVAAPGRKVALVGTTGSGKSSVVNLIPRFYDVTEGSITIDGTDVRDVTLASLRRHVGVVLQDVFLFSATIRDNLAYGAMDATQAEVERAARAAQLHDFIVSLPSGYDTWVGERGVTLSGGQKQRVAIARALLLNPPLLVLDDSTSSVDTETEHQLRLALEALMRERTTFMITQRLTSAQDADLILFLDEGRILERGTHPELMALRGRYHQVYELQRAARIRAAIPTIEEAFAREGTRAGAEGVL